MEENKIEEVNEVEKVSDNEEIYKNKKSKISKVKNFKTSNNIKGGNMFKNMDKKFTLPQIIICILLIVSIGCSIFLTKSILTMHAFTMQFVSDVFYYTPSGSATLPDEATVVPEETTDTHN